MSGLFGLRLLHAHGFLALGLALSVTRRALAANLLSVMTRAALIFGRRALSARILVSANSANIARRTYPADCGIITFCTTT